MDLLYQIWILLYRASQQGLITALLLMRHLLACIHQMIIYTRDFYTNNKLVLSKMFPLFYYRHNHDTERTIRNAVDKFEKQNLPKISAQSMRVWRRIWGSQFFVAHKKRIFRGPQLGKLFVVTWTCTDLGSETKPP